MRIHMLGIGGTGMCSLAGLFTEAGHKVTGTDEKLYPPTSDQLAELGITPFEGYRAENISRANAELAVIGNVIRRENPEAQEVMRIGLPYRSMPQILSEMFLEGRTPIVIAGTHGKTTVTALAAWLLTEAGEDPGFLMGGVGINLGRSSARGKRPFFVIEGDEYDTAFFDKGPKFLHYRPQVLLITSIEFDHADIYRDLDHIIGSFRSLVRLLPPDGLLVVNADDPNALTVSKNARCRVVTYGIEGGDWRPSDVSTKEDGMSFELGRAKQRFSVPLWGMHNLSNVTGVVAMLAEAGIESARLKPGLTSFRGVKRRQELAGVINGVTVIDDFAHHPTAVAKTIESMRMRFPRRRLWAIFEPRSNTSRRNIFQDEFATALRTADRVIVASPYRADTIPTKERLDPQAIAGAVAKSGTDAHYIPVTDHIVEFVMRGVDAGDVILVMSNGGFDGLVGKLTHAIGRRKIDTNEKVVPFSRVPK